MTRLQTKIEDKKNLAILSKELGLGKYFIISKQIEHLNGRNMEKIHEDVFEAFMSALFLSNGLEVCCLLLLNLLETMIDYSEKLYCDNNYKDILLKHHHVNEWTHPKYSIIYMEGPPHKRKYIVGVEKYNGIKENKFIGYGLGNSHKEGEQNAAKMALIIYGALNEDQYIQSDIYYPPLDRINSGDSNILNTHHSNENEFKKDDDTNSVYSNKSV